MAKQIETISIYNRSKQVIPLQARPPKGDFYLSEQQIRIMPNETVQINSAYLIEEQINNLAAKGLIKVIRKNVSDK